VSTTVRRLDPAAEPEAYDAWHDVYATSDRHGRPSATPWQRDELLVELLHPTADEETLAWAAHDADGTLVGAAWARLRLLDNLGWAAFELHVHPDHRRRGHGTALLAAVEADLVAQGRTTLVVESSWPWADDPAPTGAGPAFAARHGYELGLTDVHRELALPVPDEHLAALAAEAAPHHAAYRLLSWSGRVPDEHVAGYVALEASLTTEAPVGELDLEPQAADVEAFRGREARTAAQGRTRFTTVALAPDGDLVAYTDLVSTVHEPGRLYQWGTLVRTDHRGHRLGLALKVATLRAVQAAAAAGEVPPGPVRRATTWNAEVNAPMVAVNERLGFRPVERMGEFQKRLG